MRINKFEEKTTVEKTDNFIVDTNQSTNKITFGTMMSQLNTEGFFKMHYTSDIDDMNLIFNTGIYFVSPTTISKNSISDYGFLMVLNSNTTGNTGSNMSKQIFFGGDSFNVTMRNYVDGKWSVWKTVILDIQV